MAKCSKQDCESFKCAKLGRCGMQEVMKRRRKLTDHKSGTSSSSSEYYSARTQSMSDQQSHFSSDLEFRTAFSSVHWTEVSEPAQQESRPEEMLAKIKEMCKTWKLSLVNGISLGCKIGAGGQADIYEALFQNRSCHLIAKVFKKINALQHQCPPQVFQFEGDCKYIVRVLAGAVVDEVGFAFLMLKYPADLRKVIDDSMIRNNKVRNSP